MSAILDAKRAVERLLVAVSPVLPTAVEAVPFAPPVGMYQKCQFLVRSPVDPVFTAGYHRENLQFQVFIVDVVGTGTAGVYTRAELIRDTFYKGRTFDEAGTKIHILSTPQIGGTLVTNERVICPVMIDLTVEVYQ